MKFVHVFLALVSFLAFSDGVLAQQFLADKHVQKGISCAACHKENPPAKKVKTAKCQECHGDYSALAERTKDMKPNNVHANHLGDLDCKDCHGAHKSTPLACDECHNFKFQKPQK